ncbi:hypothetical protein FB192DRAFT_1378422 [Mucor lusitanicus]|uniref:F-box domain-containing protein n=2 Tax=Mucor circinelloides f. lusitanicus TaxID=29924 RepID=A0A8H4F3H8_MUCCL|nr:hypothetical protein FB192DRAFT_1378422 [Mucor lusitanicus]
MTAEMIPFDVILVILQFADQGTMFEFGQTCQTISSHALKQLWNMPYITSLAAFRQLTDTLHKQMPRHPYKHWISGLALHLSTFEAIPDQLFTELFQLNLEILSLSRLDVVNQDSVQLRQFFCLQLDQGIAEIHMHQCAAQVLHSLLLAIQDRMRPHLHTLCINQCYLSDHHIIPLVSHCPGLKTLKLHQCGCLSDEGLIAIANHCKLLDTLIVTLPPTIIQSNTITTRTLDALDANCLMLRTFVCGGQIRITEHVTQEPRQSYRFAITTNTEHLPLFGIGI